MTEPLVDWFGDRAVVVTVEEPQARLAVLSAMREEFPALDVRTGMTSLLVAAPEPDHHLRERVSEWLSGFSTESAPGTLPTVEVEIPVVYDGADLATAADWLACGIDALVAAHARQRWTVAMMGFAPGFGYLVPLGDPQLPWDAVPRRDRPRSSVPGGSVAVAAGMSAVYPAAMPGGWLLLGTSDVRLFDVDDLRAPTLLHPGSQVRFVEVSP